MQLGKNVYRFRYFSLFEAWCALQIPKSSE